MDLDNMITVRMTKQIGVNLNKYNKEARLRKEEQIKDATTSRLVSSNLIDQPDGRKAQLSDFKIIKVIDKGSFGKVFLVVNSFTGQLHAMKRINKDILIAKK